MRKEIILAIVLIMLPFIFSGCAGNHRFGLEKPNKSVVMRTFEKERESFEIVANFMKNIEYTSCSINSNDGTMFADFERHSIDNDAVIDAIRTLWKSGCSDILKDTENNSIAFELWFNEQDVGCGILTEIDDSTDPTVQFLTFIERTDWQSWYYYVEDYNEWRASR